MNVYINIYVIHYLCTCIVCDMESHLSPEKSVLILLLLNNYDLNFQLHINYYMREQWMSLNMYGICLYCKL